MKWKDLETIEKAAVLALSSFGLTMLAFAILTVKLILMWE